MHPGLSHVNVWQKPAQYYKVISLQLKKNFFNKKKHLKQYVALNGHAVSAGCLS